MSPRDKIDLIESGQEENYNKTKQYLESLPGLKGFTQG